MTLNGITKVMEKEKLSSDYYGLDWEKQMGK